MSSLRTATAWPASAYFIRSHVVDVRVWEGYWASSAAWMVVSVWIRKPELWVRKMS